MRKNLVLIASADKKWGLGKDNQLLKRIPEDMKRFSELTRGNLIIVGRKTLESFKNKKPLPGRINVVMTRDETYICEDAVIVHNLEDLANAIEDFQGEVFICGGEDVYQQLLPYCNKSLITQIDETFEADAHLTNLDQSPDWFMTKEGEWQESHGISFRYVEYERVRGRFS